MFTAKFEGLEKALAITDPKTAQLAVRASIERVANSGRGISIDQIINTYNVKKSDLNSETKTGGSRIKVNPPRMDDLKAVITFTGKGMSLAYFGAKQITGSSVLSRKGTEIGSKRVTNKMRSSGPVPTGVLVQILKGKDTVLLRNAFLAKMKNGHIGVFRRAGSKRTPIIEKNVISIASMVTNERVMPGVLQGIQERWVVEFPRQLQYYMSRSIRT